MWQRWRFRRFSMDNLTSHEIINGRVIQGHTIVTGAQPSAAPIISTLARTLDRVSSKLGARAVVIVPAEGEPPEHCSLYKRAHQITDKLGKPHRSVDLYRTRRQDLASGNGYTVVVDS